MLKTVVQSICVSVCIIALLPSCGNNRNSVVTVDLGEEVSEETNKKSISKLLTENSHLPIKERIALYHKMKKEYANFYNFENEDELTMYGYSLLWSNMKEEALAIFKLIAEQFPNSSNAYDSLGEVYLALGKTDLALKNYQKSLDMDPDNFKAEDQIGYMLNPKMLEETPTKRFANVFMPFEYIEDLDYLAKKLVEVHPNPYKFSSKKAFWKKVESTKLKITDSTSFAEFNWYCREIVAFINCSHTSTTSLHGLNEMLPMSLRFPLQTRFIDGRLYVIDPLNNGNAVKVKDEILTINGESVEDIMNDIFTHISSQGQITTSKAMKFNLWSTAALSYGLGFPKAYKITLRGKAESIVLNRAEYFNDPTNDPTIQRCSEYLCVDYLDEKTALLTISTFNFYPWGNLDVFLKFIDQTFATIDEKGIENLVLDVRFNGGGSPESSIHLLRYLAQKPFQYTSNSDYPSSDATRMLEPFEKAFKGEVYFIMDGWGNSTTGHFMSMAKVMELGTIVGEELGSNQFCNAGQKICRTKNTKIEFYIANNTNETTAVELPDEVGILPDHLVIQSIDDYLENKDVVKEFTLALVKE